MQLRDKTIEMLSAHPEQKFTARDIAKWIFDKYPDECREKKEKSNVIHDDDALIQQIISEIYARRKRIQKKNPAIKTTEEHPRKFYYSEKSDEDEIAESEAIATSKQKAVSGKFSEHDLYPMLCEYLWQEPNLYPKRIDEKRSRNKQGPRGNRWLYPDVVAMEDLSADWQREIKDCVKESNDKRTKLWSFEVKIKINRSNVREAFFQTVSNSSWANYGYLVAAEIDEAAYNELRILSSLHGIGIIRLNPDASDPVSESEIRIPAQERPYVDWNTANRIANENKDFIEYIEAVKEFYQTGKTHNSAWDIPKN